MRMSESFCTRCGGYGDIFYSEDNDKTMQDTCSECLGSGWSRSMLRPKTRSIHDMLDELIVIIEEAKKNLPKKNKEC